MFCRRAPQELKLAAEFIQHGYETIAGRGIRSVDLGSLAKCFDDQIDRTVMEMQPAAVG
jgi:hypothetical protein